VCALWSGDGGASAGCCYKVLLEGAAVRVASAFELPAGHALEGAAVTVVLSSRHAGAAAGAAAACRCRMLLEGAA
jgi:hypothetical protein